MTDDIYWREFDAAWRAGIDSLRTFAMRLVAAAAGSSAWS